MLNNPLASKSQETLQVTGLGDNTGTTGILGGGVTTTSKGGLVGALGGEGDLATTADDTAATSGDTAASTGLPDRQGARPKHFKHITPHV